VTLFSFLMHTLPAGKYYIGDPFLAVTESRWNEFLQHFSGEQEQLIEMEDHEIWITSTGSADISFMCKGNEYENVSGFYGVIPIELIGNSIDGLESYGLVAEFKRIFNVSTDGRSIDVGKYTFKPSVDDYDENDGDDEYEELSF